MARPDFINLHPLSKLLILAILSLVGLLVTLLLAALIGMVFYPTSDIIDVLMGELGNVSLLKYFQAANTIGLFMVPALLGGIIFSKNVLGFLRMNQLNELKTYSVVMVILMSLAILPLIDFTGYLNQQMHLPSFLAGLEAWMSAMEEAGKVVTEKFLDVHNAGGLLVNILVIGVLPALGEEMLFRGTIQPTFHAWFKNRHVAVWATAILFSAVHMQFYGFIPRMILGAYMGYLVAWSGNLWYSILAHFINNSLGVIMYYLYYNDAVEQNPEQMGFQMQWWPVVLSMLAFGILMTRTYKYWFRVDQQKY